AVRHLAPAFDDVDLGALQELRDAGVELGDDGFFPGDGFGEVESGGCAEFYSVRRFRGGVAHGFELAGDVDVSLGRDAAADQAGAAELVGFDERRLEAELAGADGGDV